MIFSVSDTEHAQSRFPVAMLTNRSLIGLIYYVAAHRTEVKPERLGSVPKVKNNLLKSHF